MSDPAGAGSVDGTDAAAGSTVPLDGGVGEPAEAQALGLVQTNDDGSTEALGDVDLAGDGSEASSPVGLVLAGIAIVALGAGGFVVARRRRGASP